MASTARALHNQRGMRRDALILALSIGLSACVAPAPCAEDSDCASGRCENGACPEPAGSPDADRGVVDAAADAAPDTTVDAQIAALDASTDAAIDAASPPDAAADALPDRGPDAAPCEADVDLNVLRSRMDAPMARGEVFAFEVHVQPPRAEVVLSAPYGQFRRDGTAVEWAPRGGNPGDLPWPWWSGPVELTVAAVAGGCRVEERLSVDVTGDVLLFDEVDGAIWVIGSDGRLLGQWIDVPGNGVTAMAHAPGRDLLVAVRQPNAAGHHLIHRLTERGELIATLDADDFTTGDGLLLGAARSIQVLPNGLITASSRLESDLPFWDLDGRLQHRLAMGGPVSALGRLGARAIFAVGDAPQIIGTDGLEPPVEVGRNAVAPQAIFALHDTTEFMMVIGADWRSLVRYSMGEYVNLRPPPVDSDVRAVTRFRDGYLVYDLRNRRLRHYDASFAHQVVPGFDPDVRPFTVAGLLWLDRRRRLVKMR